MKRFGSASKWFLMASLVAILPLFGSEKPVVWGTKVSPYVRKVMVAMEAKGISYTLKEILPSKLLKQLNQEVPLEFAQASPLGKIPAYQEGNFTLADSSVIIEYLEKAHPEHPLLPKQPKEFAKALWLEKYADTFMSDIIHNKIFVESVVKPNVLKVESDQKKIHEAIENELPLIFNYLEKTLLNNHTKFLVGNTMTIADIAVVVHFVSLKMSEVEVNKQKWPRLAEYVERVLDQPAFKKALS
jgi:glutathione S-transferase